MSHIRKWRKENFIFLPIYLFEEKENDSNQIYFIFLIKFIFEKKKNIDFKWEEKVNQTCFSLF